jgi:Kef-type K+ transport system membrane component KefB
MMQPNRWSFAPCSDYFCRVAELVNIDPYWCVSRWSGGSTTLPDGVRSQLDVLGNTLFIPSFFISLGILIDPSVVQPSGNTFCSLLLWYFLFAAKFLAAWVAGRTIGYTKKRVLIGSSRCLRCPHLAVALVAYESMNAAGKINR